MSSLGPEDLWDGVREHIAKREETAKAIGGLAKSLEYILASEFTPDSPEVIARFAAEYEMLYRQAYGDHRDDDLQSELREATNAKGKVLPQRMPGRSDPTATQAEARIRLAKVNDRLRELAERHRIRLPGDPPGEYPRCKACASPYAPGIAQMFEAGWTIEQVTEEVASMARLKGAIGSAISRATIGRHRRHCDDSAPGNGGISPAPENL